MLIPGYFAKIMNSWTKSINPFLQKPKVGDIEMGHWCDKS